MARDGFIAFRTASKTKTELEQAAKEELRSLSSLVEKICVDWLAERAKEKQQ